MDILYVKEDSSMTINEAAKILKKDPNWVRFGIVAGWLPIGVATRKGEKICDIKKISSKYGRINYYISPKLFKEFIGGNKSNDCLHDKIEG